MTLRRSLKGEGITSPSIPASVRLLPCRRFLINPVEIRCLLMTPQLPEIYRNSCCCNKRDQVHSLRLHDTAVLYRLVKAFSSLAASSGGRSKGDYTHTVSSTKLTGLFSGTWENWGSFTHGGQQAKLSDSPPE